MEARMNWVYDGHRETMKRAVSETPAIDRAGRLSREYAAALYLLTGMEYVWPRLKQYADRDGIDHHSMLDEPLSRGERIIVGLAGNLFNGGSYVDFVPLDLIDHLDGAMFELALNGIALRRGNPTTAMFEEVAV